MCRLILGDTYHASVSQNEAFERGRYYTYGTLSFKKAVASGAGRDIIGEVRIERT